ncbi:hypothetical protein [Nitrosovibrio sp. Nv4]|uniref:hypothetical protein n=1 Tax=Nitrosovibrio sp. Nv4 TaxID=1945880 RepID=UPI000BCA1D4C|nr:hypothetical protein [Nitrosovibrio sp. Nv4]SOD41326.1 hypothetical protein SAMN06298226_1621 [Nitrosovibrio sp. Nv4]
MPSLEEVRIECLKLAHAHSREATQVIERAKIYEGYVVGAAAKGKTLGLPGKTGNSQSPK